MKPIERWVAEAAVAAGMFLIGLLAVGLAWQMPAGTVAVPGPRAFPLAIGVGLAGAALTVFVGAVRGRLPGGAVALGHGDALVTLAAIAMAAVLLERAGALPTFFLFLLVLLWRLARLAWWQAAAAALVGSVAAWVLFAKVLDVRLPELPF